MRTYFYNNITKEEKESIQNKHRSLYDGYVTREGKSSIETPLTVGNYALDEKGITVSNVGEVKEYTNKEVNRKLKKVCEQCNELYEGETCECGVNTERYTNEEIVEGIKLKSKANLVSEEIQESLKWFKRIL
jgi:predicted peroxiredoxin